MRIAKEDVETRLKVPGVTIRQHIGFGDMSGYSRVSGEYFSLAAGVDTTPLFKGLDGDLCQCPHWGFVLKGRITTTDAAGRQETVAADDLFHWPPGHNVRVDEDADLIMFSPQHEHGLVIDHLIEKTRG
ncbi:cupin domain-containing protein [Geothrix fuzhouensis]|uniref:cupin domain-containing protein n=1 Tax=Geothrix fuzhouensis TaxID=2966451 RepID=UPI00352BFAC2